MNDLEITASFYDLHKQGMMTANDVMQTGIDSIDKALGKGYAAKHPELIAAFMQAAISDMNNSIQTKLYCHALKQITEAMNALASEVGDLPRVTYDLFGDLMRPNRPA